MFRELIVWQKAMTFVTEVYRVTADFPPAETYGLTSQIRRCAVSIPSNIAEGYGRRSDGDYVRFLLISQGSLFEIQTQLEIARNLQFIEECAFTQVYELSREIERMMSSFIRKIKNSKNQL